MIFLGLDLFAENFSGRMPCSPMKSTSAIFTLALSLISKVTVARPAFSSTFRLYLIWVLG